MRLSRRLFIGTAALLSSTVISNVAFALGTDRTTIREDGLVGEFHVAPGARHRTAVVMLNGSDGGIPSAKAAADLAAAGYPVLALAYFKDWQGQPAGVPATLNDIPLEYFFKAIDWLKARPEVDAKRIVLMGQSRGGELVLLIATLRPDVAGVIAFSPSSRVWGGIPAYGAPAGETHPAWTLGGKPVAYQNAAFDQKLPMREWFERTPATEAARIRVEDIRGPVLLVSSKVDKVWPGATYADEIATRLATRRSTSTVQNLQFDDASHLLMGGGPGLTLFKIPGTTLTFDFGGTQEGNTRAREQAWATIKTFLAAL